MPFARAWCPPFCAFLESGGIAVDLFVNNCGREACAPGHRFGPAMRGYHLIHIAASGCGVFDNGAARFDVRAGQGFMIFPDDVSVYTADAQTPPSDAVFTRCALYCPAPKSGQRPPRC